MPDDSALQKSLLLVDDEPQVLTALTDLLEDEFEIFAETSPSGAIAVLQRNPDISVIMSDQRMPEMSGDEFLARARLISPATRILITGFADLKAVIRAVNNGKIFGYVSKPWDPNHVTVMVHKAVEHFEITRELVKERSLLENLMNSLPDAVAFKDAAHHFLKINAAQARAYGIADPAAAVGRRIGDFVPVDQAEATEREEREIIATGRPVIDKIEQVAVADGSTRWMSKTIVPVRNDRDRVVSVIGLSRDVTERLRAEEDLRRAHRLDAVGRMTGGLAHDFNNLLAVIVGNLDLLQDQVGDAPRARRLLENTTVAALRGAALTRQMLAFARRQSLAAEAIDIGAIVRTTVELLRRTIGESIDIRLALAADLSPALADPAQVESALANLAINARDAMPRGGTLLIEAANVVLDEREAAFSEAKPGAYVMLAVSDTGTGIPADVLDHVYEPFFTTKEAGKGTGLGLSMVYGFARQSGGLVRIHSELGRGTSVRLYLPRAEDAPSPLERRPADDAVRGGSERILLVEDNAAVRETAAALLEDLGYAVRFVESGAAALLWLDRGEPVDLLLTDVILPHGMTGHELAAEAVRRRPGLKVVFATGFSDPNIHHERLRLGPTINKPARKTELARILREVLDGPGK